MWYPVKTPFWLRAIYPRLVWHKKRTERTLYLTFDDGPIPVVTPAILKILKNHGIKATFFCVGDNIRKHPEIFKEIKEQGHSVGNHTYHHLNGWKTSTEDYIKDVQKCQEYTQSPLFRPPYARGTFAQYKLLYPYYQIIMWDVMSGDFDTKISPEQCLKNVIDTTENGSIIVFHDNEKAASRVLYALPKAIEFWKEQGYSFETL